MAKTLEQYIKENLGQLAVTLMQNQVTIEQQQEKIQSLEKLVKSQQDIINTLQSSKQENHDRLTAVK